MSPEKLLKDRNIQESLKGNIETPSLFQSYGSTGKKSRPTSSKKTSLKMKFNSIDVNENHDDERRNT